MTLNQPFTEKVINFMNLLRIVQFPLTGKELARNPLKYNLLIYVEDFKCAYGEAHPHWMYITSHYNISGITEWMNKHEYKQYTGKRKITKYAVIETSTGKVVRINELQKSA